MSCCARPRRTARAGTPEPGSAATPSARWADSPAIPLDAPSPGHRGLERLRDEIDAVRTDDATAHQLTRPQTVTTQDGRGAVHLGGLMIRASDDLIGRADHQAPE